MDVRCLGATEPLGHRGVAGDLAPAEAVLRLVRPGDGLRALAQGGTSTAGEDTASW